MLGSVGCCHSQSQSEQLIWDYSAWDYNYGLTNRQSILGSDGNTQSEL